MGGFLLIKNDQKIPLFELEELYRDSIYIFKKKGLKLSKKILRKEFVIFLYHKYSIKAENIFEYENNDFIISIGTSIYKGKTGAYALKELFEDFANGKNIHNELNGNYAIIISHKRNLFCFNDYLGLYRIYFNNHKNVFSNSLLSVSKTLKEKSISIQELYEYIFNGAFYGDKTIFKEIELLCSKHIWQILPKIKRIPKIFDFCDFKDFNNFNEMLNIVSDTQIEFFKILKNIYNNKITSALSGGYDTRLMLALAKKVGISLNLYVYGEDNSVDVKIAKKIAEREGIKIDHINKNTYQKIEIKDYYENIKKNYYCFDGLGNTGIFDNGSDIDTRIKRTRTSKLQLNGGAGGIYRNSYVLKDKTFSIKSFLKFKYDFADYSICTNQFNKNIYFSNFEEKIKNILSITGSLITRKQIEMLLIFLRSKYWMAINNSINNQFAYSLTPYTEPIFFYQSFNIPMKYKNYGLFEASLIRKTDENISKYYSEYGFDFFHKIKARKKIKNLFKRNVPTFIMPFIRRKIKSQEYSKPYFLQEDYLKEFFNLEELFLNKYINVRQIKDNKMLSRVLSIELLLRDEL